MLFKGVLITSLSGSVDGITASHNRGGAYLRSRVVPVDPLTIQQNYCRSAMGQVAGHWNGMSADERAQWSAYARSITITNRIGDQHTLTGRAAFFRELLPRSMKNNALDNGAPFPDPYPPSMPLTDFPTPPGVAYVDAHTVNITWPAPMGWENIPGDDGCQGIVLHLSTPQPKTVNWFRGPYRPAYWLESDEDDPPTSPFAADLDTSTPTIVPHMIGGHRFFWSLRLFWNLRPNGRVWSGHFDTP